jgi:hypothetical protein
VIDNLDQVERLLARLEQSLPLAATVPPSVLASLKERSPGIDVRPRCSITRVHYTGDEGGIICRLGFGSEDGGEVLLASITHLAFDPRLPLARQIAAYQKHRIKRLRRG